MAKKSANNIFTAFLLNLIFAVIELIGGIFTNSMSIIAGSMHDFSDSLSIAVSWFLEKKSEKKPNKKYTYGYSRFSTLGALISSIILFATSIAVIYGAVTRIINPAPVHYEGVLVLAVLGLVINGLAVYKVARGSSLNEKSISLHLLDDVFGWAAILIMGIIMRVFDISILDPIVSLLITAFILFGTVKNLKSVFEVFLEKAPKDVDMQELREHLIKNANIKDIHHIHLWTLDGINKYVTLHAEVTEETNKGEIVVAKCYIRQGLKEYGINHSSIEIEFENENCTDHECSVECDFSTHLGHGHE